MFAAQLTRWNEDLTDIVGLGATRDEALQALWPHWFAWISAADEEWGGTTDARTASAWLDAIANGEDNELAIRWVEA